MWIWRCKCYWEQIEWISTDCSCTNFGYMFNYIMNEMKCTLLLMISIYYISCVDKLKVNYLCNIIISYPLWRYFKWGQNKEQIKTECVFIFSKEKILLVMLANFFSFQLWKSEQFKLTNVCYMSYASTSSWIQIFLIQKHNVMQLNL